MSMLTPSIKEANTDSFRDNELTFDEYQKIASSFRHFDGDIPIAWPMLGLAGEMSELIEKLKSNENCISPEAIQNSITCLVQIGNLAEKAKKIYRDSQGKITPERLEQIKKEAGDVLWYYSQVFADLGLNFSEVAIDNIH
jgi:NTP pyrophosphatase (non-canonical NTP hydrolase)